MGFACIGCGYAWMELRWGGDIFAVQAQLSQGIENVGITCGAFWSSWAVEGMWQEVLRMTAVIFLRCRPSWTRAFKMFWAPMRQFWSSWAVDSSWHIVRRITAVIFVLCRPSWTRALRTFGIEDLLREAGWSPQGGQSSGRVPRGPTINHFGG